jgi:hypothetical protein
MSETELKRRKLHGVLSSKSLLESLESLTLNKKSIEKSKEKTVANKKQVNNSQNQNVKKSFYFAFKFKGE